MLDEGKTVTNYTDYGIIESKDGASYEKLVVYLHLRYRITAASVALANNGNKQSNGVPTLSDAPRSSA